MIRRLAIIPARGGSKRLKNKNIAPFHKKPLIYYSIKELIKVGLFSKIHISTDSPHIKSKVQKLVEIDFLRPRKLSGDTVPVSEVIKFVINEYKKINLKYDEVWLIYATNPLIQKKFLTDAYKLYLKNKKKYSILSVNRYSKPIEWAMKITKNKVLQPVFKKDISKPSNEMIEKYYDAGMFVIYQKNFETTKNQFKPFIIPIHQSVDIDNKEDFELAKRIY